MRVLPLLAAVPLLLTACAAEPAPPSAAPAASSPVSAPASPPVSPPVSPPASPPVTPPTSPAASTPAGASPPASPAGRPAPAEPEVVARGLQVPWGLAFLPGGDALVSERTTARVLRVPAAGGEPVEVRRLEAAARGEGGLLGLALSPAFAQDDLVYAYVTTAQDNRVVRFPLGGGPVQDVLTGIPSAGIHNGGRLVFGPDGHLYVGTGDAGDPDRAQDPDSLGGKVLRVTPDGGPVGGTRVFSSGHRNVQGLGFDEAGRLWATEFGQDRFDEVNQLTRGGNGGWPQVEGEGTGGGRFTAPQVVWTPDEASPSGLVVAGDALYVAALRGRRLWRVPLQDGRAGTPVPLYRGEYGRLRTVAVAPDGSLWFTTSNRDGRGEPTADDDRLLRVALPG